MNKGPIQAADLFKLTHTSIHINSDPGDNRRLLFFRAETKTFALHKGGGTDPSLARTKADTVHHFQTNLNACCHTKDYRPCFTV